MAIYVDEPFNYGGHGSWSHLISDTSTSELVEFGKRIGLDPKWLQYRNGMNEHFDVRPTKRELALSKGAVAVTKRELGEILRSRRGKYQYEAS